MPGSASPSPALIPRPRLPRPVGDGLRDGRSRLCRTDVPAAHGARRRRGRAADAGGPRRSHRGARRARGDVDRPARRRHAEVAAGLFDRGLRLSARPRLGHRPEGQGQRRPAHRGAERAQGAHRGRARARADPHRRIIEHHHQPRDRSGVPQGRLRGRHQGRRARHQGCASRRRGSRQGACARRAPGQQPRYHAGHSADLLDLRRVLHPLCRVSLRAGRAASRRCRGPKRPAAPSSSRAAPAAGAAAGRAAAMAAEAAGRAEAAISAAAARREAGKDRGGRG